MHCAGPYSTFVSLEVHVFMGADLNKFNGDPDMARGGMPRSSISVWQEASPKEDARKTVNPRGKLGRKTRLKGGKGVRWYRVNVLKTKRASHLDFRSVKKSWIKTLATITFLMNED